VFRRPHDGASASPTFTLRRRRTSEYLLFCPSFSGRTSIPSFPLSFRQLQIHSSLTPSPIAKQSVLEICPQDLALPIVRHPLFPGFYKAAVLQNPGVVAAIRKMMKRGQPFNNTVAASSTPISASLLFLTTKNIRQLEGWNSTHAELRELWTGSMLPTKTSTTIPPPS
jgi:hypothetical protein